MNLKNSLFVVGVSILVAVPSFAAQPVLLDLGDAPEVFAPVHLAPPVAVVDKLDSMLHQYSTFELPAAELDRQVRETGRVHLVLDNRELDLVLEPNDLRGEGYREVLMTPRGEVVLPEREVTTFKGTLADEPTAVVRLSVTPDTFTGYVRSANEWVFIDPLSHYSDRPVEGFVVYRDTDVKTEAIGECGAGHLERAAHDLDLPIPTAGGLQSITAQSHVRRNVQVANDGDGQLFRRYGNPGVFNFMSGVVNAVDGIYGGQLNLDASVVFQQAWSDPATDPYTSLDASTTLNQLRNWWEANRTNVSRDAVHQFSGKDFNGGTIGIAWVGVLCRRPDLSYGVSQDMRNSTLNKRLTSHEIGHNLDADHDSSSCANCNGTGPIMCASIQSSGTNSFSSCSKNQISSYVHNFGSCL